MTLSPFTFRLAYKLILFLSALLFLPPSIADSDQFRRSPRLWPAADQQQVADVPSPRGSTPVVPREMTHIKKIANSSSRVRRARSKAGGLRRSRAMSRLEPVQTLYVQRHIEDKNADPNSRKADVYYYDYSKNEVIQVVTDLNTNKVQETHVSKGVENQPFFTSTEINAALQLVFDHPELGPRLRSVYLGITGQSLDNVNQLIAQGGVFFPDSAENTALGAVTANCVEDRCMQLFVSVDEMHFIDVSNLVVDLSRGEVLWVEEGLTGHSH